MGIEQGGDGARRKAASLTHGLINFIPRNARNGPTLGKATKAGLTYMKIAREIRPVPIPLYHAP